MSLDIQGFSGKTKVNATMLDQQQGIAQMSTVKKNWFTHTLFFKIITFGIGALVVDKLDKKEEDAALQVKQSAITLLTQLEQLAEAKANALKGNQPLSEVASRDVVMSGETVKISLNDAGKVCVQLKADDDVHVLDSTVEELRRKLAEDVFTHAKLFSKGQLRSVLPKPGLEDEERMLDKLSTEDTFRRAIYEKVIQGFSGVSADELQNVTTANLQQLAESLLSDEGMSEKDIKDRMSEFDTMIAADNVNSLEAQSLVNAYREQVKSGAAEGKVTIEPPQIKANAPKPEAPKAKAMRELCADLIYNEDIDHDVAGKDSAQRLRMVLLKHVDALVELGNTDDVGSLGLEEIVVEMLNRLKPQLKTLCADSEGITAKGLTARLNDNGWIIKGMVNLSLKTADALIGSQVDEQLNYVQEEFNKSVDKVFASDDSKIDILDADSLKNSSIKKLFDNASSPDAGYGLFMKNVLKQYFANSKPIDKRSMAAAAIRYGYGANTESAKLGATLKGAGPLMQKMLQGLDASQVGWQFGPVIKDMKKNLAPIPEEVVKANMLDIVNRAGGKISNLTVVKSLGRASVGEAFHCKVTGPAYPEGKDIVVKILRPDALQKLKREEAIFSAEAKKVSGMEFTFKEQLESIKRELDFTLEDANIQTGELYNHGYARVKAVKTLPVVLAAPGCLVMEKAPGDTVDGYLDDLAKEVDSIMAPTETRNTEDFNVDTIKTAVTQLTAKYQEIAKRQKDLCDLATKWVTEGLYGKGFFHGDLHAGNIMVADEGLTVIDFGNVTQLSDVQKAHITAMMAAAGVSNGGDAAEDAAVASFVNHFKEMLSPEGKELLEQKRQAVENMLKVVLAKGGRSDTGSRIFVAINYIQRLGVEVPGAVFKFSQSQIRLQNTIEAMNKQMMGIKQSLTKLASTDSMNRMNSNLISKGKDLETKLTQGKFAEVNIFFNKFVRDQTVREQLDAFIAANPLKDVQKQLNNELKSAFYYVTTNTHGDLETTQMAITEAVEKKIGEGGMKNGDAIFREGSALSERYVRNFERLPSCFDVKCSGDNPTKLKTLGAICQLCMEGLDDTYHADFDESDPEIQQALQDAGVSRETIKDMMKGANENSTKTFCEEVIMADKLVKLYQRLAAPPPPGVLSVKEMAQRLQTMAQQKTAELSKVCEGEASRKIQTAQDPEDFCDRMSTVILQNLKTSCSRVDTSIMKLMV